MIVWQMWPKMLVNSWWVAATETEQGSAGRTPTSVEKMRLVRRSFLSPVQLNPCNRSLKNKRHEFKVHHEKAYHTLIEAACQLEYPIRT